MQHVWSFFSFTRPEYHEVQSFRRCHLQMHSVSSPLQSRRKRSHGSPLSSQYVFWFLKDLLSFVVSRCLARCLRSLLRMRSSLELNNRVCDDFKIWNFFSNQCCTVNICELCRQFVLSHQGYRSRPTNARGARDNFLSAAVLGNMVTRPCHDLMSDCLRICLKTSTSCASCKVKRFLMLQFECWEARFHKFWSDAVLKNPKFKIVRICSNEVPYSWCM